MFERFLKNFTLEERSWIKYDIANSAYTLTFVTVFFPIIFKIIAGKEGIDSDNATSILLYATGIYAAIVAILAPILGSLADYKGHKIKFFRFFLIIGLVFALLLTIPEIPWQIYLVIYMIATIGYTAANVFYDSFLTDVTDDENFSVVSSNGFAWGYIGSTIPFILGLLIYAAQMYNIINIPEKYAIAIAFLIAIIWWGYYSLPMLKNVEQKHYIEKPKNWISHGFKNVFKTFKKLAREPKILFFLIGYFLYIDVVGTIIKSATNIGKELEVTDNITLVILVLLVQFIAFPCAILFGNLAKKIGEVKMLTVGILIYITACVLGFFIDNKIDLFVFAGLVGLAQGGIQAVSRSYYSKLIPKEHSGDYFGFFNIFGKFAAIIGPIILGLAKDYTGEVRFGILSLVPLLIIGLIFLLISGFKKPKKEMLDL